MKDFGFNPAPPLVMHLDLNSCFATIEQQANPHLRGKPVAVAAYTTSSGCIIAPSVEAKRLGIKVGMRVKDGRSICPSLVVLPPDPWKYRNVHRLIKRVVSDYTDDFSPKSIDEFVLNLSRLPYPPKRFWGKSSVWNKSSARAAALEIKKRIKKEIGDWLTVSVGLAPNRYLAKVAAGLHKPDGLDIIDRNNFWPLYQSLALVDLPYIKKGNAGRLNRVGISDVADFYRASLLRLKAAFASIGAHYWYMRLKGWEVDAVSFKRRSYGNSYALPKPFADLRELSPIVFKLVEKASTRFRRAGFKARGVHLAVSYRNGAFWHRGVGFERDLFDPRDIYKEVFGILSKSPLKGPVREISISCFNLVKDKGLQLDIFGYENKKADLIKKLDEANDRWGDFAVSSAKVFLNDKQAVCDRIAFGLASIELV